MINKRSTTIFIYEACFAHCMVDGENICVPLWSQPFLTCVALVEVVILAGQGKILSIVVIDFFEFLNQFLTYMRDVTTENLPDKNRMTDCNYFSSSQIG